MTIHPSGTLGQSASFWVSAGVVSHTLWTSAAPAVTYPLYASEWNLSFAVTTAIFSIYPIVVVTVLVFLGDVSDYIGRRETMLLGLAASLIGVLLFAVAPSVPWLFAGRIWMGIGVGLSASPATAAMVEFSPAGQLYRASFITAAAQAVGFGSATLVGGALIEYAPFPTRLNFWVLFAYIAALLFGTWLMPRQSSVLMSRRWSPRLPFVPAGIRTIFAASAAAAAAGYTIGSLILSLGAQTAHDLIGSSNALINGAAISLFAVSSGAFGLFARRFRAEAAVIVGGLVTAASMALFALATSTHSLPVFLVAIAVSGIAYSLTFLGGLMLINAAAPDGHRAASLSAFYLVAYFVQGAVALLLGLAANAWGLRLAIHLGTAAIAVMGIVAIALIIVGRPSADE
jgi:MFS family permease